MKVLTNLFIATKRRLEIHVFGGGGFVEYTVRKKIEGSKLAGKTIWRGILSLLGVFRGCCNIGCQFAVAFTVVLAWKGFFSLLLFYYVSTLVRGVKWGFDTTGTIVLNIFSTKVLSFDLFEWFVICSWIALKMILIISECLLHLNSSLSSSLLRNW